MYLRKVEKLNLHGNWTPINFRELKPCDMFRMYDGIGCLEMDIDGNSLFVCLSKPEPLLEVTWKTGGVKANPFKEGM